jgi:pimeloyl-ACP methyl ester carboxylesterase
MFRNLIPALADEFHLVAPAYPSYGQSSFPTKHEFDYTFERFHEIVLGFVDTVGLDTFSSTSRTMAHQSVSGSPRATQSECRR